jgi:hypothetical protein
MPEICTFVVAVRVADVTPRLVVPGVVVVRASVVVASLMT